MNAAEITDKLGLHSLRQRAWVRFPFSTLASRRTIADDAAVHPIHLRHLRRWSLRGSRMAQQLPAQGWPQLSCGNTVRLSRPALKSRIIKHVIPLFETTIRTISSPLLKYFQMQITSPQITLRKTKSNQIFSLNKKTPCVLRLLFLSVFVHVTRRMQRREDIYEATAPTISLSLRRRRRVRWSF